MSSSSYTAKGVKCPFYAHESKKEIVCEGLDDNYRMTTRIDFADSFEKERYKADYCKSIECYKRCRLTKTLDAKYD